MKIFLGGCRSVDRIGSFDELAVDEDAAGAQERDQVRCVDHAPAGLGSLDDLEYHGQPGRARAGAPASRSSTSSPGRTWPGSHRPCVHDLAAAATLLRSTRS